MSNIFDDVNQAITAARMAQRAADQAAADMAKLLVGRLRFVSKEGGWAGTRALANLKKELRDFNIHTGQWKQKD